VSNVPAPTCARRPCRSSRLMVTITDAGIPPTEG
jgi:hypothetical protein